MRGGVRGKILVSPSRLQSRREHRATEHGSCQSTPHNSKLRLRLRKYSHKSKEKETSIDKKVLTGSRSQHDVVTKQDCGLHRCVPSYLANPITPHTYDSQVLA